MEKQFVDYKTHLQEILDVIAPNNFVVSEFRNIDVDKDKINVVVNALGGSVYKNSASIPYQVEIATDKIKEVQEIFNAIAKQKNNNSFIEIVEDEEGHHEYTVYEFYSTPSLVDKDFNFATNQYGRLVMFVTLNVLFEVGNISSLKVDGEEIEFQTGTIAYDTEKFSVRETGQNLNKAIRKSSATTIQLTMVNKTSIFTNKIFGIMFGTLSGNTKFNVNVTLTNGVQAQLTMILANNSFNFAKNSPNLPSLSVTLGITKGV